MQKCKHTHTFTTRLEINRTEKKEHYISVEGGTCCVKAVLPPGIGKLDEAMGRRSRGEPVLFLLSVRE